MDGCLTDKYALFSQKKGFRSIAWERLQRLDPKKYAENYRRFPLKRLLEKEWQSPSSCPELSADFILPESDKEHFLLLANGVFQKSAANAANAVYTPLTLSEAEEKFSLFLEKRLLVQLHKENDPLALLNLSCAQEGIFLYIPPYTELKKTVHIHNLCSGNEMLFSPRVHLLVGKGASLNVSLTGQAAASSWVNFGLDILMDEQSSLKLTLAPEERGQYCLSFFAQLKKNSRLEVVQVGAEQKRARLYFQATLAATAAFNLSGLNFLRADAESYIQTHVEHVGENATSFQKFKTVLEAKALAHFNGKIYVHKEAQGTEAYQLNKALNLSDSARVYSQPRLEIYADDVKASHGATIGQLTEEELFYLLSRGIPAECARRLIIEGFCKEIIDTIPSSFLREKITNLCK